MIALLNRAIRVIAVQLSAFRVDDQVVLHFTKVLDLAEPAVDEEAERVEAQRDRSFWEMRSNPTAMGIVDKVIAMLPSGDGQPRVAYNAAHISVRGSGRNYCSLYPRQKATHCLMDVFLGEEERDEWVARLDGAGLQAKTLESMSAQIRVRLTQRAVGENEGVLRELLAAASEQAKR